MKIETLNQILNDLWNLHLVFFGISVSIFTLLFSFIINKKDILKSIAAQIKKGSHDPLLLQQEVFAKKHIMRLKSAINKVLIILMSTIILFVFGWLSERFVPSTDYNLKLICLYLLASFTCLIVIFTSYTFWKIYQYYIKEIKIT